MAKAKTDVTISDNAEEALALVRLLSCLRVHDTWRLSPGTAYIEAATLRAFIIKAREVCPLHAPVGPGSRAHG